MKTTKKTVFITIEYYDRREFVKSIESIKNDIVYNRLSTNKQIIGESKLNWRIQFDENENFREEIINGVLCRIYKSKMNE